MVQNLYKKWLHISKIIATCITPAVGRPKSWNSMSYICLKTTFLHIKHYLHIYLTLLSTTCVKIHQISYDIFETISHFSNHNSSILFQLKRYILLTKNIPSKCNFSDFSLFKLKFIKFLMSFFKQEVSFSLYFGSLFSVLRDNPFVLF